MKITIKKPTTFDAKYVKFSIPIKDDDISVNASDKNIVEQLLSYSQDSGKIEGYVDIDTGCMSTWVTCVNDVDIFSKVVDEGEYSLYDKDLNYICGYEGYVPAIFECNEIGWGDYFNMTIESTGHIRHWEHNLDEKLNKFKREILNNY